MTYLTRLSELERAYDGPIPQRLLDGLHTPERRRRHMIARAERTIAELQRVIDDMESGKRRIVGNDLALYRRWRDQWVAWRRRLEETDCDQR